jgi:hypothetical protein
VEAAVGVFEERLGKVDITDLEANREKSEDVAVYQEVPDEEAAVETIGALEDLYGDRNLPIGSHRQLKKRTHGDGGSRQKLAAAKGRLTRRAVPAPRKGHSRQGSGKDDVLRGSSKGRGFVKERWAKPRRNDGLRDQGLKHQLWLRSKGNVN